MNSSAPLKKFSQYYSKVKTDIKLYSNIACILDKVEQDGNLLLISNTLLQIFNKEIVYAVYG